MMLVLFSLSLFTLTVAGAGLAAWLYSSKKFKQLVVWIPLCLIMAAGTYWTIDGVMGLPSRNLPAAFILYGYKTDGKTIYVWGTEKGSTTPRTWAHPYEKQLHEQLETARKSGRPGTKELRRAPGDKSGRGESDGQWQQYDFAPPMELPPKAYDEMLKDGQSI